MLTVVALIVISAVTCIGSLYARFFQRADGLIAIYVLFVSLSQVIAAKIAIFDFGLFEVTAPAGVLIFGVTFLITDIVSEKFGRSTVHYMIILTFITQVILLVFLWLAQALPPAPFWDGQQAWEKVLGLVPRITIASLCTFLISENLDAVLYQVMRRLTKGRHLWARNVFSSAIALTVDTLVFVTLAFVGTDLPLLPIMTGQFLTKYIICLVDIPFMYLNRAVLGPRMAGNEPS